ncbi:tetratricopeptide repeat protein [Paenisporosarcina sp. TG20]|uniref:tetratricopeptide repeat protein n=1 Tax=Paenisporosarcina sp. TG20 TaxID=1211706 RepID=UPI0002D49249|nr:tetratricopeptide repeat protein [Paenisporosarcina sp. TG20]
MFEIVNLTVSPLIISNLIGRSLEEIPNNPNISDLPGEYVKLVAKNINKVHSAFPINIQPLVCKNCGKKDKFDLGLVTINVEKYKIDQSEEIDKHIQSTGYFRCKNCNSAGKWEISNEYRIMAISALLSFDSPFQDRYTFGKNVLFDGSSHHYATDAEEHLLKKIMKSKEDAYLWNRLGNLYYKGNRADLAVYAYEQSISIDPMQTESRYSLGMILTPIDPKEAAKQYHSMLISASKYTKLSVLALRDLLSNGLRDLVYLNSITNGEISLIPPMSLYQELQIDIATSENNSLNIIEGDLDSDNLASFYPIAETFMGKRGKKLPKAFMKKKKTKKKEKKRKKK